MKNNATKRRILRKCYLLLDSILFSGMIAYSMSCLIRVFDRSLAAVILFPPILILVCMIRMITIQRKESDRKKVEEEREKTELLLLMSDDEIGNKIGESGFYLIRRLSPDRCDVLEAVRNGAEAIGVLKEVQNGKDLLDRYSPNTKLYEKGAILQNLFPNPSAENKYDRFRKLLQKIAENKYLILGFFLMIASIWANSKLYFRLLAEISFLIGGITTYFSARNRIKKMLTKEE